MKRWFSKGILIGVFLFGSALILLALLAPWLGLDNDAGWGPGKLLLLASGTALALLAVIVLRFGARIQIWWQTTAPAGWFAHLRDRYRNIPTGGFVLPAVLLCGAVYLWFLSAGSWFSFPEVKNSYNDLAAAFNAGQLALLIEPDPALAALENPYDAKQRANVPFEWDLSYYQERYYLYWGPVPALVLAPLKALFQDALPGQTGLLIGSLGVIGLLGWLAVMVRDGFFPRFPRTLVGVFILAAGINLPFMFLVSRPQVYETSILFGQMFLLLGTIGLLRAFLADAVRPGWLAVAGLGWGLAVGSRYSLVGAVGVLTLFALLRCIQHGSRRWVLAAALLAPLVLAAALLMTYNFFRFGALFETGFGYQLTVPHNGQVFSPAYLPGNASVYLGVPLNWQSSFPFLRFEGFDPSQYFFNHPLPAQQFDEFFAGLAGGVPLVGLVLLAVVVPLLKMPPTGAARAQWLLAACLSAAAVQWLLVGSYYYAAVRFLMDGLPLTLLAGYMTVGLLFSMTKSGLLRRLLGLLFFGAAGFTIIAGFLAGFDAPPQYFRITRPEQFEQIASQANFWLAEIRLLPERTPGWPGVLMRWIFY